MLGLRFCARAFSSCASGGHSSSRCAGLSLSRPLLLRSTGSRRAGSAVVAHGPSCSAACGILPDQGSNPCPLHWQADSQPLRHQGSPVLPNINVQNSHTPREQSSLTGHINYKWAEVPNVWEGHHQELNLPGLPSLNIDTWHPGLCTMLLGHQEYKLPQKLHGPLVHDGQSRPEDVCQDCENTPVTSSLLCLPQIITTSFPTCCSRSGRQSAE